MSNSPLTYADAMAPPTRMTTSTPSVSTAILASPKLMSNAAPYPASLP
jgi:hypothetical protein